MKRLAALTLSLIIPTVLAAQSAVVPPRLSADVYQPKSSGDKAHSEAEFSALAYMRTVENAEKLYYRKHTRYAESLNALVGTGSFTRRMASPNRGDYTVVYRALAIRYALVLTPKQFDANHRSFCLNQTGQFHAEDDKQATENSPLLR